MENRITSLFGIRYPIVAGGMIWCSGWRLAAAVSEAGGLGLIGSGSMTPDLLREHIRKCRAATEKPFGVNVPLMYRYAEEIMGVIMEERVPAVFTSAGSPKTWTARLHEAGCKVAHVISSTKFALKSQQAGVDAVVAEGFEAGGHNGREETTTMVLVPRVRQAVAIPLIAAGGIATGRGMLAAFALGAEGIQMGTRFALSEESSASDAFKKLCIGLQEGDTMLALKKLSPTRGGGEQGCDGRRVTAAAWTRTLETGHLRRRPDGRRTGNRAGSLADPRAADGGTDRPRNRCGIRGRAAGAREASNELQGGNLTIREVFCPVFSESRLGTDQSGRLSCISPSGRHRSARIAARDSRAYSPRNRTAVRTEGQRRTVICPIVMKAAE